MPSITPVIAGMTAATKKGSIPTAAPVLMITEPSSATYEDPGSTIPSTAQKMTTSSDQPRRPNPKPRNQV